MSIEFHCSRCGRLLRTGDDTAGRMAQCPQCGAQTQVPAAEISQLPSFSPSSGQGGSFDSRGPEPAASAGSRDPYQTTSPRSPGQGYPVDPIYALKRVSAPAVCLIVTAVLGIVLHVVGIVVRILHIGVVAAADPKDIMPVIFVGPIAIFFGAIGIILGIVVLTGAIKMKGLENYGLAMAASILAMIPCISPCCFLGLPFGIWALVVLCDPMVKSAFKN